MTDISLDTLTTAPARPRRDIGLKTRYAAERRFRIYGVLAIAIGLVFLAIMLISIVSKGYTAFWQTTVTLPVDLRREGHRPEQQAGDRSECAGHGELSASSPRRR